MHPSHVVASHKNCCFSAAEEPRVTSFRDSTQKYLTMSKITWLLWGRKHVRAHTGFFISFSVFLIIAHCFRLCFVLFHDIRRLRHTGNTSILSDVREFLKNRMVIQFLVRFVTQLCRPIAWSPCSTNLSSNRSPNFASTLFFVRSTAFSSCL